MDSTDANQLKKLVEQADQDVAKAVARASLLHKLYAEATAQPGDPPRRRLRIVEGLIPLGGIGLLRWPRVAVPLTAALAAATIVPLVLPSSVPPRTSQKAPGSIILRVPPSQVAPRRKTILRFAPRAASPVPKAAAAAVSPSSLPTPAATATIVPTPVVSPHPTPSATPTPRPSQGSNCIVLLGITICL